MNPGKFISLLATFLVGSTLLACGGGGAGPIVGGPTTVGGVGEQMAPSGGSGGITQNTPLDSGFPDPKKAVPNAGYFAQVNQPAKEDACLLPADTQGNRLAKVRFNGYIGGNGFIDPNGYPVRVVHSDTNVNRFQDTAKTHPQDGIQGYFEFTIQIMIPTDVADNSDAAVKRRRVALLLQPSQGLGVEPSGETSTDGEDGNSSLPSFPLNPDRGGSLIQRTLNLSFYAMANTYESPYTGGETECSANLCQPEEGKQSLGSTSWTVDDTFLTWLKERNPCPS